MGTQQRFRGRPGMKRPGRGKERGGSKNFSTGRRFENSRLAENRESSDDDLPQEEEEEASEDEAEVSSDDGPEDDDQPGKSAGSYMALMKSLTEDSGQKAKRQKLDHATDRDDPLFVSRPNATEENQDGEIDVDLVEEPEEDPGYGVPEDLSSDDEDEQLDTSDPFETHFAQPDEEETAQKLKALQNNSWTVKKFAAKSSRMVLTAPQTADAASLCLPPSISSPSGLKLKQRVREVVSLKRPHFDATEQRICALLFHYYDVLSCERSVANAESLRRMACLHAVNHMFKTRDRIIKNNTKIARAAGSDDMDLRDQGFTRPKVLMLLPTRQSCARMVDMICSICEPDQQENRKRFDESYIDKEQKFSDDKPQDFRELFDGNDDDNFRLGLKFTRKTIKYFAQFYNSDIIFASPLGLRLAIGSEEEKKVDFDFLSSIEMVIVDQADALLMQQWAHVEFIFEHLNRQPREAHGCDFSRVRSWYLDNQSKYFRQTVVLSAFNAPELSELLRSHCHNWAGKVRIQPQYPGIVEQLGVRAKQTFSRFESPSVSGDPDARFDYFTKAIVPSLVKRTKESGTLVFIPSYFDFLRVRNYFATASAVSSLSFGSIEEHAEVSEASRARSHFLSGRHRILLYTERAHHFRRYRLRGVQRVVFYGLPSNPVFYKEITGGYLSRSEQDMKLEPGHGAVRAMFSKYDMLKLERIVGSQRVGKMMQERSDTFVLEDEKRP